MNSPSGHATAEMPRIKFLSHACIEVTHGDQALLCDPWFFGKVFNNSWQLLVPTDQAAVDYARLRYIWISHEHPDHFHFPTLKKIVESATLRITVFFQRQQNKNVVEALRNLGFDVVELDIGKPQPLDNGLTLICYRFRSDSALVIQAGRCTILNQNDCRLGSCVARKIRRRHGPIDLWLFQFSLAGYYANHDDESALQRAHAAHLSLIRKYDRLFRAERYVPFASFVGFCRRANRFLNRWHVRPGDVLAMRGLHASTQLLCNNGLVLWDDQQAQQRNPENLAIWNAAFDQAITLEPETSAKPEELLDEGRSFANSISKTWPRMAVPGRFCLRLTDLGQDAIVDLRAGRFELAPAADTPVAAEIDSSSLLFLVRFPWGADTVHISACFYVRNAFLWKWFTYVRHTQYKLDDKFVLYRFAPLVMAFLQTRLRWAWYK